MIAGTAVGKLLKEQTRILELTQGYIAKIKELAPELVNIQKDLEYMLSTEFLKDQITAEVGYFGGLEVTYIMELPYDEWIQLEHTQFHPVLYNYSNVEPKERIMTTCYKHVMEEHNTTLFFQLKAKLSEEDYQLLRDIGKIVTTTETSSHTSTREVSMC